MGQKVNTIGFRKGVVNFWESYWYLDKLRYANNFFDEYVLNLYFNRILRRFNIIIERFVRRKQTSKTYISIFYYRLYFKLAKNISRKLWRSRKRRNIFHDRRRKRWLSRVFRPLQRGGVGNSYGRRFLILRKKRSRLSKRNITRYCEVLSKVFIYYKRFLYYRLHCKRYNLFSVTRKLFSPGEYSFLLPNSNTFLILDLKKDLLRSVIRNTSKHKRIRSYFDMISVVNIAIPLRNVGLITNLTASNLVRYRRSYKYFCDMINDILRYYRDNIYDTIIQGFRFRMGGKTKGRKKNRSSYIIRYIGALSLMSFDSTVFHASAIARTPYGVLGLKLWLSFKK